MRRAAVWLFPLIAFAVAVFIVLFLMEINPSAPKIDPLENDEGGKSTGSFQGQIGNWISHFSNAKESGYFYPVNEVTLKLDMGCEESPLKMYRLTIQLHNSEELLQVKDELKKNLLPYVVQNGEDARLVTVDSADQTQLQSLVTKLKTYQITATVAPYTEEK